MSKIIRIRRGESKDFREDLMKAGELAIDTDTGDVHACYQDGKCNTLADAEAVNTALDKVDNLEVGGRNLLVNTLRPDISDGLKMPTLLGYDTKAVAAANNTFSEAEHGIRVTMNASAIYACYYMNGTTTTGGGQTAMEAGQEYTISFDWTAKAYSGTVATNTRCLRMGLYTDATGKFGATWYYNFFAYTSDNKGTEQSGRCKYTFTFPDGVSAACLRFWFQTSTVSGAHAAGDFLELRNLKLEKGNKATDWTPAPEDTAQEIATAQSTANSAAAAATQAQSTADAAKAAADKIGSYETITLTKTDDIASVESAWAIKRGDGLVWLYIQATTAATVSSATAKLFSGLPKPRSYSRVAAQMGNTNASCRVGISTDGNLYNAYTQVSAISGQPLCVNCMYFAE